MGADRFSSFSTGKLADPPAAGIGADAPVEFAFLTGDEAGREPATHELPASLQANQTVFSFSSANTGSELSEDFAGPSPSGGMLALQRSDEVAGVYSSSLNSSSPDLASPSPVSENPSATTFAGQEFAAGALDEDSLSVPELDRLVFCYDGVPPDTFTEAEDS